MICGCSLLTHCFQILILVGSREFLLTTGGRIFINFSKISSIPQDGANGDIKTSRRSKKWEEASIPRFYYPLEEQAPQIIGRENFISLK